jgi:flagellar biosynthesis protein FlhG
MSKRKSERLVKTIAIASGKGGVGKTNIITNLGVALRKMGKEVLIFDADLGLSNIDVLLSLAPKYNIEHLIKGEKSLKEIIIEGPNGIKILPAGNGVQELTSLNEFDRLRVLEQFDEYTEKVDIMLIDTSAGISENVTFFCTAVQENIIVVTPEPTSITDAYALIKILHNKYREKDFNLVVNLAKNEDEAKEVYKRLSMVTEKFLKVDLHYLGFVRYDENVKKAVKMQDAFVNAFPNTNASKDIFDIANKILDSEIKCKGSMQFFLRNVLSGSKEGVCV